MDCATADRTEPGTAIRYVRNEDVPAVAAIDLASFPYPWDAADIGQARAAPGVHTLVAVRRDEVVGYALFESGKKVVDVVRLAVRGDCRRLGVATALMDKIRAKTWGGLKIRIKVRESSLPAQLFLRKQGFVAETERQAFENPGAGGTTFEDGYVFSLDAGFELTNEPPGR